MKKAKSMPDLGFDVVKGLVAGGASLALQVVAPMTLRASKRFRARWSARKAARKAAVNDDELQSSALFYSPVMLSALSPQ
jgi:hypothetical protein